MTTTKEQIQSLLDSSGFPFQSAVTEHISRTTNSHNYYVYLSEHPWYDEISSESGFIDLVIQHGCVRIVIECKRVKNGVWLFTVPNKSEPTIETARLPWQGRNPSSIKHGVAEFLLEPCSYQSRECILRGQDDDNRTLLERLGGKLLHSIDAMMKEDAQIDGVGDPETFVYIPCIITTAELVVASVDPNEVSIEDGTVTKFECKTVDFIKFRKSLVNNLSHGASPAHLADASQDKERSLLIMNSKNLDRTLKNVAINLLRRKSPELW
jgi:hypothetical protein